MNSPWPCRLCLVVIRARSMNICDSVTFRETQTLNASVALERLLRHVFEWFLHCYLLTPSIASRVHFYGLFIGISLPVDGALSS